MGWCSATWIFDNVCSSLLLIRKGTTGDYIYGLQNDVGLDIATKIIEKLTIELEEYDWDCQQESDYWKHPIVQNIFKKLHPNWFTD